MAGVARSTDRECAARALLPGGPGQRLLLRRVCRGSVRAVLRPARRVGKGSRGGADRRRRICRRDRAFLPDEYPGRLMVRATVSTAAAMACWLLLPQADRAPAPIPLPVERASNVFFARATINGRGPFWFTVDTGATLTVIDPAAATRAELVVRDAGRRPNVGITAGDVAMATTSGARIQVGDAPVFAPTELFVVPVRANAGYLGHAVDGVLGTDFLRRHIVEFQYAASRVALHAPMAALNRTGPPVEFTIEGNLLVTTATLGLPDGERL